MESEYKTSDEILEELFSALNLPLSPKTTEVLVDDKNNANDSDGSDDKEASSKSSASEEDVKERVRKNHKRKSSKKKKEKKKKKKKHKKKDEDSRHKSKKKHKKDCVIESDFESGPKVKVEGTEEEDEVGDISLVIQELLEKFSNGVHPAAEKLDSSKSKSPKQKVLESPEPHGNKKKSDIGPEKGSKELVRKSSVKLNSSERSHSSSKSLRSRSRSTSKLRQVGSRSRSRSKHFRYSRSRSRSKHNHHSRSSSRTKSSSYKSGTKSPRGLETRKRGRSRSHSKSPSPKLYKRSRTSRSHSRSFSPKSCRRRFSKSRSKSRSPKPFRRKGSTRSRSPSPLKMSSGQRSRSRSGSRKRSCHLPETSSSFGTRVDGSKKHEVLNEQSANVEIDLSAIPTPGNKPDCSSLPISLESIPLPIPLSGVPDPSSIPLPQPVAPSDQQQPGGKDHTKGGGAGIDVGTIPVPVPVTTVETSAKEQEPAKQADTNSEKGKAKTIIIKSLKDSLIYLQAQEEAERRAKVKEEDQTEILEEKIEDENENDGNDIKEAKESEEKQSSECEAVEKEMVENVELEDKNKVKEEKKKDKEEGELSSEEGGDNKTKSHKKKSKKDKSKDKKKSKKEKTKDREKRKRSKERSRSKDRTNKSRTRSRSKERSKHKRHSSSSRNRDHDADRRHRRHSRSRSRSRDHFSRHHRRSYSRSRSRSRSRTGRKRDCVTDLRDKVNRKRLLEIARRNAVYLMQNGCLPPSVEQEQLVKIKTGGKSVEELTDFCKQLVASGNYSDVELSDPSLSSDEDKDKDSDKPFTCTRHPFNVRDSKPILMNIRNAPMLPTKTNAERLADHAKLREQFPVSSGSQHRNKGEVTNTEDKHKTESGWVPVSPKEKKPKEEDSVFAKQEAPAVDISQIVSSRLSAMRKLQDNPHDVEALNTLRNVQKEMQSWALSKQEPGQFTGSTGVKILSQEELCAGQQAWVRKEQFKEAAPVRPQFGLKMLQKMGWTPGEGLGKNKEGAIEPLLLDVKMDKKGFHAQEELTPKKQPIPMAKDLAGKHPVSALVEHCSKHKWQPPQFEMVFDYGPDHKKNFLMKVRVNGQEYKPAVAGPTKKLAKANAAAACLQSLGLFPKDPENPITETPS